LNKYEELISEAQEKNITVVEKNFRSHAKGLCKGTKIGIRKDIPTQTEKSCVLAEEIGHYYTTYGNILDQKAVLDRKQELRARMWAYDKKIGLIGLVKAFEHGCRSKQDIIEYLDVTEEFLHDALEAYKNKYGNYVTVDNYVIYFEPALMIYVFNGDILPEETVIRLLNMEISKELCPAM